jgi:nicotinamidase/pyrazinamidase
MCCSSSTFRPISGREARSRSPTPTGLAGYLRERGFRRVLLAGLAIDFCVAWSAVDAREAGFDVVIVEDACRAIDNHGSLAHAWTRMRGAGIVRAALNPFDH